MSDASAPGAAFRPASGPASPRPDERAAREALEALGVAQDAVLTRIESGHINESFRVDRVGRSSLLLQWLNHHVFPQAEAVAGNAELALAHLRRAGAGAMAPDFAPAPDGARHVHTATGCWRAFHWLADHATHARPLGPAMAGAAGATLGGVLALLATLPAQRVRPALVGFHDVSRRLMAFDAVRAHADARLLRRAAPVLAQIDAARARYLDAARSPQPPRVLHGDPKFTNFLFPPASGAPVLVDWDTLMIGPLAWDFGDFLRSAASRGEEDEPHHAGIDDGMLEAATRGFLRGLGEPLDAGCAASLARAPAQIAFVLALRFATDFLDGDRYFRVQHGEQNLDRAAVQLTLAAAFGDAQTDLVALMLESTTQELP